MMKRFVSVCAIVACMTTGALADVLFVYDTGHPMGPTFLQEGEPTDVAVSISNSSDATYGLGAVIFSMSWDDGLLSVNDFAWQGVLGDMDFYFFDNTLPEPSTILFGFPGHTDIAPGGSLQVATMTVTGLVANTMPTLTMGEPPIVAEDFMFSELLIKGGDTVTFNVVPEPATLLLLAVGGLCALRRRK